MSSPPELPEPRVLDDNSVKFTGFGTAHLRAIESARSDHLIYDPFAGLLTQNNRAELAKFAVEMSKERSSLTDLIAIRTRYLDEALMRRNDEIQQVVILGAGFDTRAYRMESLRGCHVLELDQAGEVFDIKSKVLQEIHAPMVAQKLDYIVADLADNDWDGKIRAHGFQSSAPSFWVMEGLLPYMKRSDIVELLDTIDALSAPASEFWADMATQMTFTFGDMGEYSVKYGEEDPMHGVLSEIPWCLMNLASLEQGGEHFGRKWIPIDSVKSVSVSFMVGVKPVPAVVSEKELCPGLDF